jgi:hypothetical protein
MLKPGSPTLGSLRANRPDGESHAETITNDEISDAAEALREVEIEAARGDETIALKDLDISNTDTVEWSGSMPVEEEYVIPMDLEELSIDELRAVAGILRIPNYVQITDQEELVALIRTYAEPMPRTPK